MRHLLPIVACLAGCHSLGFPHFAGYRPGSRDPFPFTPGPARMGLMPEGTERLARSRSPGAQQQGRGVWSLRTSVAGAASAVRRVLAGHYTFPPGSVQGYQMHTEWDRFYLDGRLFRNRIAADFFPGNRPGTTDVVLKNAVEAREDGGWFPCPDFTDELERVGRELAGGSAQAPAGRRP